MTMDLSITALVEPRGGNYHWIDNPLVKVTRYNGKFTDLIEKEVKN